MNAAHRAAFTTAFQRWFAGDACAIRFCLDILDVAHTWDDLIDRDVPVSNEQIDAAFRRALIYIPSNPFYRQHMDTLTPVLESIWLQWRAANVFEREDEPGDRQKAYMLRAAIYQLFASCAAIVKGPDWAAAIAPEVWRLYGETVESFRESP